MTDKELLELAAKAAGIINQGYCESGFLFTGTGESGAFYKWNPLTNDGDALRLAVKCALKISHTTDSVIVSVNGIVRSVRSYYGDPYAATRRAIVRAAAEIGRNK